MDQAVQNIFDAALKLSHAERVELLEKLSISLDGYRESVDRAWLDECYKRSAAYERGDMESIPAEEVLRSVDEQLQKLRT